MNYKTLKITLITLMLVVLLLPSFSLASDAVPSPSDSFYVNDFANVIDQKTENYMVNYGVRLHKDSGAQVVLVTVDSTGGTPIEEYATSLFNSWGIGSAEKNNGLLLLLSIKDDDYWAVQGKGLDTSLSNDKISEILSKSLEPDFAVKAYSSGARKAYGAFIQSMGGTWAEQVNAKNYVSDNAGVFKKVTKDYLNEASNRYMATTGNGIYVVTVKNTGNINLQDYTYKKFASIGAGPKDVMMVLDIGGDNYHVLQGKDIDTMLTNENISTILDANLEAPFVKKDYGTGATATANAFYNFFLSRADQPLGTTVNTRNSSQAIGASGSTKSDSETNMPAVIIGVAIIVGLVMIFVIAGITASRRNRYLGLYGIPLNPYSRRSIRRYGNWQGQADYGYGSRWYNRHHHRQSAPPAQNSFFGNSGGGGSTNGGGAGRHSSHDENEGGGGSSSGGGAGRHSSGSSGSSGGSSYSGSSSGGGSSSKGGGGSASSGGGAGRH